MDKGDEITTSGKSPHVVCFWWMSTVNWILPAEVFKVDPRTSRSFGHKSVGFSVDTIQFLRSCVQFLQLLGLSRVIAMAPTTTYRPGDHWGPGPGVVGGVRSVALQPSSLNHSLKLAG